VSPGAARAGWVRGGGHLVARDEVRLPGDGDEVARRVGVGLDGREHAHDGVDVKLAALAVGVVADLLVLVLAVAADAHRVLVARLEVLEELQPRLGARCNLAARLERAVGLVRAAAGKVGAVGLGPRLHVPVDLVRVGVRVRVMVRVRVRVRVRVGVRVRARLGLGFGSEFDVEGGDGPP